MGCRSVDFAGCRSPQTTRLPLGSATSSRRPSGVWCSWSAARITPLFSPDGRWLAYADEFDGGNFERPAHSVIYDTSKGRVVAEADVLPLAASADSRALIGLRAGRTVVWLDAASGAERHAISIPQTVQTRPPRISPDGRYLAWWKSWDGGAIHDLEKGTPVHEFAAGTTDAQFSPDGKSVALMTAKRGLRVLDVGTWSERALPLAVPSLVAWSRDSRRIAFISGSNPPSLSVLDAATMTIAGKLTGQGLPNMRFAFSGDGKTLVSSTRDGTLRFWNLLTWSRTLVLPPQGQIGSFSFAPGDEALLLGRAAGFTRLEAPHTLRASP